MQTVATTSVHHSLQFPSLFARSSDPIQPNPRKVPDTYANQLRDSMGGVEVQEISWADWEQANPDYQPICFM